MVFNQFRIAAPRRRSHGRIGKLIGKLNVNKLAP
jgi:hypothetical protein